MKIEKGSAMHGESGYARIANDAYFTPAWVTLELTKFIGDRLRKRLAGPRIWIWEPACGNGAIVNVLRNIGFRVYATDIAVYDGFAPDDLIDFMAPKLDLERIAAHCGAIITNPPYDKAEEFVERALVHTSRGGIVCMLLRHEWDCAASRGRLFSPMGNFAHKLVLTKRPRWSAENKASPRHNFAWFIWDVEHVGAPTIHYAP